MAERKPFLLRLPPDLMDALNTWARDELRSLNSQIEYVLREALRRRAKGATTLNKTDENAVLNNLSNGDRLKSTS
ncbi:MAG: Arc family DNA-binding protein [Planctomycetes bacterium]|nr:Arc family DNA-binding protein [Planctomycetota bacterium]MBI3834712.1 Arc family DNA-binding protein [Planctomycetota bacterium]